MDNLTPKDQPPHDSENGIPDQEKFESSPLQWPQSKRVGHVVFVSVLTLVMYFMRIILSHFRISKPINKQEPLVDDLFTRS